MLNTDQRAATPVWPCGGPKGTVKTDSLFGNKKLTHFYTSLCPNPNPPGLQGRPCPWTSAGSRAGCRHDSLQRGTGDRDPIAQEGTACGTKKGPTGCEQVCKRKPHEHTDEALLKSAMAAA